MEYRLTELDRFCRTLEKTDQVAVESTGNTRYFVDKIRPFVKRVVVVDPNHFEVIRKSVKKTDEHDAEALSFFLSKDMLPEARMKDKEEAQVSSVIQTRDQLVKLRTSLYNKIHGILNSHGMKGNKESYGSEKGLERVLAISFDAIVRLELKVIVDQIRSLNAGIRLLDEEIASKGKELYKGHMNLTSIKGIGDKAATILLSVIGDVKDFSDEGKLAAYLGIVPRVSKSNETEQYGHITRRGSKIGRTTLVQCTLVAKRYSPYLQEYFERIKARRGGGKAIIATARKFLGIIYRTLKYNWVFEDFPNFVIAEERA
jgi:transposase